MVRSWKLWLSLLVVVTIPHAFAVAGQLAGYVYTLDNDVARNGVAVYARHADGTLSEVAGSPFMTGGRGLSGGDIDEQEAIRVHGQFVLAVNPGSDSVSVFHKCNDGKLMAVPGSPFPSGGHTPLSVTVHRDLVYVANQAAPFASPKSAPNIPGFRMMADGKLMPIANSTILFPAGVGPAKIEFCPTGEMLAVSSGFQTDEGSRIHTFKVMNDGRLMAGPNSPAKPMGASGTVGFSLNRAGDRLFVSNFRGSALITFAVDHKTGGIQQMGEPVREDQTAACWMAMARDGKTLYVANFVSNSVSVYDVHKNGKLTPLGSVPRRATSGKDTKDIEVSPDGQFLYVIGSGMKQISAFKIGENRLPSELPECCSPMIVRTGQNTTGLAVEQQCLFRRSPGIFIPGFLSFVISSFERHQE